MLQQAVSVVEEVIAEVDTKTGLSKCEFAISRLDYIDDRQVITVVVCFVLFCHSQLCTAHSHKRACMLDIPPST